MTKIFLQIGGLYCLAFAIFNILFWKIFRWRQDLLKLLPVNRAITQVLNLRLIYIFIVFSIISTIFVDELLTTVFGKFITVSISVFWFMRAIEQVLFFDLKSGYSIAIFLVFILGGTIYILPFIV